MAVKVEDILSEEVTVKLPVGVMLTVKLGDPVEELESVTVKLGDPVVEVESVTVKLGDPVWEVESVTVELGDPVVETESVTVELGVGDGVIVIVPDGEQVIVKLGVPETEDVKVKL